jgi:hypothetical protein
LLHGGTIDELDFWLIAARSSGIYGMQRFARTIRQYIEALRNAESEPWSNGQTEGQINKLKTLKRAMYGRASVDLLRARMAPLQAAIGASVQRLIQPRSFTLAEAQKLVSPPKMICCAAHSARGLPRRGARGRRRLSACTENRLEPLIGV